MIQENKEPCKHLKNDEYYICVNGPCLKNSIYKLSCHQCLLEEHLHPLAIQHIDSITNEALTNQRELIEYISVNLDYCQNKKEKLVSFTQEIKQQIYQQLDAQQKLCQQQIDLYQQTLLRIKQQIDIPELSKNLDQILGLKLFDRDQFLKDNFFIKSIVDQNILMFQRQVPSINPSIYPIENDELPNLTISFLDYDKPKYQVCQKNHDLNVAAICTHEQCLDKISLKCPVCMTLDHQGKDHSKNFIFNKLEEEYKVKLSELESFCEQKSKDVWRFLEEMPKLIQEIETIKQQGLLQFKQFIYLKGKVILKICKVVFRNIEARGIQYILNYL